MIINSPAPFKVEIALDKASLEGEFYKSSGGFYLDTKVTDISHQLEIIYWQDIQEPPTHEIKIDRPLEGVSVVSNTILLEKFIRLFAKIFKRLKLKSLLFGV